MNTDDVHLRVVGLSHRYSHGDQLALSDINLDVHRGELITFLGPSGCGKTTLLRIISGFIDPTEGQILLNGEDLLAAPPNKRPTNLVFQRPTLFPHLDVTSNIEFGLKLAKVSKSERARRVRDSIELLHLGGLEKRRPNQLSGGQMQRVALARALVNEPEVLLLDEPLSALDMQIRLELEVELRRVHRETGATFLYVTHDQRVAMALADRVVVFDHGRVAQVGAPENIYRCPDSAYVAKFVGDANILRGEVVPSHDGNVAMVRGRRVGATSASQGDCSIVVRAEDLHLDRRGLDDVLDGTVIDRVFRGSTVQYRVELDDGQVIKTEDDASSSSHDIGDGVGVRCVSEPVVLPPSDDIEQTDEGFHA